MCGRFARFSPIETFATLFNANGSPDAAPCYNIAPTHRVLAARNATNGTRELVTLHWGLIPHWSKGPDPKYSMINARADSVASKPAYREPFRNKRCLIAADGFFEWRKVDDSKQPYFIRIRHGQPFAFAGLWDHWQAEGRDPLDSCTIITTAANALIATIYDRMPVILPPKYYAMWLDTDNLKHNAVLELLKPYPDLLTEAWPVGKAVNNPMNDSEALLAPAPHAT
jgi:putative SOS response-associated peptidase YedK